MQSIRLGANMQEAARKAALVLQMGDVVLYPTDTLYGLGADAFSNTAVDKIYTVKGRDEGKPIHALVRDLEMAERFCEVTDSVRLLAERLPKGKVTFVCKKKTGIDTGICRGMDTFGFRIPDSEFCLAMIEEFGGPVTATSANKAGSVSPGTVDAIRAQLEEQAQSIALVVDGGELPTTQPSTVVSFAEAHPVILREGAVPAGDVWNVLRELDLDGG